MHPEWLLPPHNWPRDGAHKEVLKVVDWKVVVGCRALAPDDDSVCLCLRCACYRNYLLTGTCKTRDERLDLPLLARAYSNFAAPSKLRGVLFEARLQWRKWGCTVAGASRAQVRSTVCMHFTSWHALELVARFDYSLWERFGHFGVVDDALLQRVMVWSQDEILAPYQPLVTSNEV